MRFFLNIFYILLTFQVLSGCENDDANGVTPEHTPNDTTTNVGGNLNDLNWEDGFPIVSTSPHSINIRTKISEPGNIYYVLSDSEIENISGPEIKRLASQNSDNADDKMISGVLSITPENLEDTISLTLNGLESWQNIYSYYIAEEVSSDSTYLMSDEKLFFHSNVLQERERENMYLSNKRGKEIKYLFYALEDYYLNPFQNFPLLIFLHGKGEYSTDGDLELYKNGTIPELIHNGTDFPFVVVSPQIDSGRWDTDFVDEFIEYIVSTYRIDQSKIYMTGNSLGGVGTWEYANDYPDRLAAMVPISGHGFPLEACNIKDIPVWAFHNSEDPIVDTSGSLDMIAAINSCQPSARISPILTIYPEEGHDAWVRTYDGSAGHDIFSWMLKYKKDI